MSEEHKMNGNTDDTTTAGTTAVKSPTRQPSKENQRPRNLSRFSANIQTSPHDNSRKPTLPEAMSQMSYTDHDGGSTGTDPFEAFDELLASLESDDEKEQSTECQAPALGDPRAVPSVLLETPPNRGLDDIEVLSRRKRYGLNMMKEEHRSHLKTFLMFFVGPIQFVMLVGRDLYPSSHISVKPYSL